MNRQLEAKLVSFLTVTLVVVVPAFAQIPDGVSPGAADRIALDRRPVSDVHLGLGSGRRVS